MINSIFMKTNPEKIHEELTSRKYDNLLEQGMKKCDLEEDLELLLYDVADAIQENHILLIEGQENHEIAYLIPVLLAYHNSNYFNRFIIATSSTELQEKILQKLQGVSLTLGIHLPIHTLDKEENYLCIRRLHKHSKYARETVARSIETTLLAHPDYLKRRNYSGIPDEEWEKVHVKNCSLKKCTHYAQCKYRLIYESIFQNGCVITSHETFIGNIRYDVADSLSQNADLVIIEEAEKLSKNTIQAYYNSVHYAVIKKYLLGAHRLLSNHGITLLQAQDFYLIKQFFDTLYQSQFDYNWNTRNIQEMARLIASKLNEAQVYYTKSFLSCGNEDRLGHTLDILSVLENFFLDIYNGGLKYNFQLQPRKGFDNTPSWEKIEICYYPKDAKKGISEAFKKTPCSTVLIGDHIAGEDGEYQTLIQECGLNQSTKQLIKEFV